MEQLRFWMRDPNPFQNKSKIEDGTDTHRTI